MNWSEWYPNVIVGIEKASFQGAISHGKGWMSKLIFGIVLHIKVYWKQWRRKGAATGPPLQATSFEGDSATRRHKWINYTIVFAKEPQSTSLTPGLRLSYALTVEVYRMWRHIWSFIFLWFFKNFFNYYCWKYFLFVFSYFCSFSFNFNQLGSFCLWGWKFWRIKDW